MKNDPPLLHETKALNPWQPDISPINLAVFGKLVEELNECGAICARCIIQGIDEAEPVTRVLNREALEKEAADVLATVEMLINHFKLDREAITARIARKMEHLKAWHRLLHE